MARGWESKSVEAQIEARESRPRRSRRRPATEGEIERLREREILTLSRTRVLRDLEATQKPRYKQMLRKALEDLEARLTELDQGVSPLTKSSKVSRARTTRQAPPSTSTSGGRGREL